MDNRYVVLKNDKLIEYNLTKKQAKELVQAFSFFGEDYIYVYDEYYEHTPYTEEEREQVNRLVN